MVAIDFSGYAAPIRANCIAINKQPVKNVVGKAADGSELIDEEILMAVGTTDGRLFTIDPITRSRGQIRKYTPDSEKPKKSVELVKWLATPQSAIMQSNRFVAVFSDGTMALYHKDREVP